MKIKHLPNYISNDIFLLFLVLCLIAIVLIGIVIVVSIVIVQHNKTKRTEILAQQTPSHKKKKIIEKQLEKEIENNGKIVMLAQYIADKLEK